MGGKFLRFESIRNSKRITKEWLKGKRVFVDGSNLHPNPRFYKYYWWVFYSKTDAKNAAEIFWRTEHRLTTAEFAHLMKRLTEEQLYYAYVNRRYYRLGMIWDYHALSHKYPGLKFASAYDDDPDELYEKHK